MFKSKKFLALTLVVAVLLSLVLTMTGTSINLEDQNTSFSVGQVDTVYAATPDYVCDGVSDDVQFQLAMDALPASGGQLIVLSGDYVFAATVARAIDGVTIVGTGEGSSITYDGVNPIFNCGAQSGWYFENLTLDAGGITTAAATDLSYQNVWIGTAYHAYWVSTDTTSDEFYVPTQRSVTYVVAASDSAARGLVGADYICDGVADDVQIQAAIDALPVDGGRVILLEGNYLGGQISIQANNVVLEGQGRGTIYKLADNTDDSVILVGDGGANAYTGIVIKHLVIDGNKANQAGTSHGIRLNQKIERSMIEDVYIHDCLTDGIKTEGTAVADGCERNTYTDILLESNGGCGLQALYAHHLVIDRIVTNYNGSHGIRLYYSNSFRLNMFESWEDSGDGFNLERTEHGVATDINMHGSGNYGINFDTQANDNSIIGFIVEDWAERAISLSISTGNQFIGGYFPYGDKDAIYLDNSPLTRIDNCIFTGAGQLVTNTYTEITLNNSSENAIITNNVFFDGGYGAMPKYDIRDVYSYPAGLASDGIQVKDNAFSGAVTSALGPNLVNNPTNRIYSGWADMFMDLLVVDVTHVRSNEALNAGVPITFTIDAQPDVPRTLSWAFDSHAQITEYDMEVIGVDAKGNTITETWDEGDGWTGETDNAFATITSIKMTSRTGTGAGDTMDIGITDHLGLSNVIYAAGDVYKVKENNADLPVVGGQVDVDYGTYDLNGAIGAADDFTIWFRSNLNVIG